MKKILWLLLIAVSVRAEDEPNFEKEKTFFNLYQKYNVKPTNPDYWSQVVSNQKSRSYLVQKGDTLWNLSETLFGDSEVWPKLWSVNSVGLDNPHVIMPGNEIRFFFGDEKTPPSVGVNSGESLPVGSASDSAQIVSVDNSKSNVKSDEDLAINKVPEKPASVEFSQGSQSLIPIEVITSDGSKIIKYLDLNQIQIPPGKPESKVLGDLPSSLPAGNYQANTKKTTVDFSEITKTKASIVSNRRANFFVNTSELPVEGVVLSGEGVLSKFESGFIGERVLVQGAGLNGNYLVVRTLGPIKSKFAPRKVQLNEVLGEVQIFNVANGAENIFRATVKDLNSRLLKGAKLVRMSWPRINLTPNSEVSSVDATVFGSSDATDLNYIGEKHLVFLDRGSNNGVQPGQVLRVYKNTELRDADSLERSNLPHIGTVQVVQVSESVATAVVIQNSDPIRPGDRTSVITE